MPNLPGSTFVSSSPTPVPGTGAPAMVLEAIETLHQHSNTNRRPLTEVFHHEHLNMSHVTACAELHLGFHYSLCGQGHDVRVDPHTFEAVALLPETGSIERASVDAEHFMRSITRGPSSVHRYPCLMVVDSLKNWVSPKPPTSGGVSGDALLAIRTVVRAVQYHDAGILYRADMHWPLSYGASVETTNALGDRIAGSLAAVNIVRNASKLDAPDLIADDVWAGIRDFSDAEGLRKAIETRVSNMAYATGRSIAGAR